MISTRYVATKREREPLTSNDLNLYAHLFLAEAHFAMGSRAAGERHLRCAQGGLPIALVGDLDLDTLLAKMDVGNADSLERAAFVRRVRAYLDRDVDGAQASA